MNRISQKFFDVSQMICKSSNMQLATEFRFSSLALSMFYRVSRQAQRRSSTFTDAMPVGRGNAGQSYHLLKHNRSSIEQNVTKRLFSQIVEEGAGTHKPSPFQKKVLVWGKMYPSVEKVPERVTRNQMKKAMDKFRVRVSLMMVAATFVCSAIMALIGRKQRNEGQSVAKQTLARRGVDA